MAQRKTVPKAPIKSAPRPAARPTVSEVAGDDVGAAEMNRRVAESLKRYRKLRDLSLDELAIKSGVSRAALSQIEGGRTNPTLSVLWKVAAGLAVRFHELLDTSHESGAKLLRAGDAVVLRSADGRVESRLLTPGGAPTDVELYELRFAAKGVQRSDSHGRGTTETVCVLKGALRVAVGDEGHELLTGDTLHFSADVAHAYENRGSSETRVLNIIRYQRGF
jgi:XRE family transcriptional regulator, regulator of sulfur utilization